VGGPSCPQRMAEGKEAKETSLECPSFDSESVGEETPSKPESLGGDEEEEDEDEEEG
jgi:ferredoxin-thioredoxin reductase catalytic subunit